MAIALLGCDSSPQLDGDGGDGDGDGDGDTGSGASGNLGGSRGDIDVGDGDGDGDNTASGGSSGFDLETLTIVYDGPDTIDVRLGEDLPTVTFSATVNGRAIDVGWSVDRGELATISSDGVLTPSGNLGGFITVRAGLNDKIVEYRIQIRVFAEQNGSTAADAAQVVAPGNATALTTGGGIGGVGGEGLGGAVVDDDLLSALSDPTGDAVAQAFRFLYPYDGTVWPRSLSAPLLMWESSFGDADALRIDLETTGGSFTWSGTFDRPAILATTGGSFIRHPIPQSVWERATNSAGGLAEDGTPERLTARITIVRNGVGYGPISQTWIIAGARASGTIYYNSYGTNLAKNFTGAVGGDGTFGGAVLSIRVGDSGPELVAGSDGNADNCQVCHSVASGGSRLLVRARLSNQFMSGYDLDPDGSTPMDPAAPTNIPSYPALSRDGTFALSSSGNLIDLNDTDAFPAASGLADVATNVGTPSFSPDGEFVAFNPMTSSLDNPRQKLVVMGFNRATGEFSDPTAVADYTGLPAERRPGWPAFFPDGRSLVFHDQSAAGLEGNNLGALGTRRGAKAQIAWTSLTNAAHVTRLNRLNGLDENGDSYLPVLSAPISMSCTADGNQVGNINPDHGDDANTNYTPTVSPVAAGGYAWVVFVSRRMYGNVATIPPYCSDPRGVDLIDNITTKKLWVAAIDLNMKPGEDHSFPAFYLPGQELLAGNARGFWVLDPCRDDGESCETGDQCCGGFCQPNGVGGALVCSNTTTTANCSAEQEKCETAADCCDSTSQCINEFCAKPAPTVVR